MTSSKVSKRGLVSLIAIATAMLVGNACNFSKGGSAAKEEKTTVQKPTTASTEEEKPGNVDETFELAVGFSSNKKSIDELRKHYDRLNQDQRNALCEKSDTDGARFLTLLTRGVVDQGVVNVMEHFLTNIDPASANLQIETKYQSMNAFDIMRRNGRAAKEKTEDVNKVLAVFLNLNPKKVNDLTDRNNNEFEAARFNGVFVEAAAMQNNKVSDFIKELTDANFETWLFWAVKNRKFAQIPYASFYLNADENRRAFMRNKMLDAAFAGGPTELAECVNYVEELQLDKELATDFYKIRNKNDSADFEGPFLYVLAKRMSEEWGNPGKWNVFALKSAALAVKRKLGPVEFEQYVSTKNFGENPGETIMQVLLNGEIKLIDAKVALALKIIDRDIIDELKVIASATNAAHRVVTERFAEMIDLYANDPENANCDSLANFTIQATDVPPGLSRLGGWIVGDKFLNTLSQLKTDDELHSIFDLILNKVTNPSTWVADIGSGSTPLKVLCDDYRPAAVTGSGHEKIIALVVNKGSAQDIAQIDTKNGLKLVLNAVDSSGIPEDLTKVFAGASPTWLHVLGKFFWSHEEKSQQSFSAAYPAFSNERKEIFRTTLFASAYDGKKVIDLVTGLEKWGLKAGIHEDVYAHAAYGDAGKFIKGKFLYVAFKTILGPEDISDALIGDLHIIAGTIKDILGERYVNHVTDELFSNSDGDNETIYQVVVNSDIPEPRAKYILHLNDAKLTEKDVYTEINSLAPNSDTKILHWLYGNVIKTDPSALTLASMKDMDLRFIEALASLKATPENNAILTDLLAKLHSLGPDNMAKYLVKSSEESALCRLADPNRDIKNEDPEQRKIMINKIINAGGPQVINQITRAVDLAFVLDTVVQANNVENLCHICQGVTAPLMPNLLIWVDQKPEHRQIFKTAYEKSSAPGKANMASALVARAYKQGPIALNQFIDDMPTFGMKMKDDQCQMAANEDILFKGHFMHVIAMSIAANLKMEKPVYTLNDLHLIAGKVKAVLQNDYKGHVTTTVNIMPKDTLANCLDDYLDAPDINFALQLNETVDVANVFKAADIRSTTNKSSDMLVWSYNASITKDNIESLVGINTNGLRFLHLLALGTINKEINTILDDFLNKVGNIDKKMAAGLIQMNSDFGTPLQILTDTKRPKDKEPVLHRQWMISRLAKDANPEAFLDLQGLSLSTALDAVLHFGQQPDLIKAMSGVSARMLHAEPGVGFASWAYNNRTKLVINGDKASADIPQLYAAEYQRRFNKKMDNDPKHMRESIFLAALNEGNLGNGGTGIISVLLQGFLPKEACGELYSFNNDNNGTILYSLLEMVAQANIVNAIAKAHPADEAFSNKWEDAQQAIQIMLRGGALNDLKNDLSSEEIANIAFKAVPKSLTQVDIKALAQAIKARAGAELWNQICNYAQNSVRNDMHVWHLINVTTGNTWTDDVAVKTPAWLDYQ